MWEHLVTELADLDPHWQLDVVQETPSTQALLKDKLNHLTPATAAQVVIARHQIAGRGRLDRSWSTPADAAITMSLALRPAVSRGMWPWLTLMAALAVREILEPWAGDCGVKWPNDVLVRTAHPEDPERKICGILAEVSGDWAVLGIGVNILQSVDQLPVPTATSLALVTDRKSVV